MKRQGYARRPPIPADIERAVLIEAGHRCAIQTCRETANLDLHHIIPWEKCHKHAAANLIALCPNCHRLAHGGNIDRKSLQKYKAICQSLTSPPLAHQDTSVHAYLKLNPNTAKILDAWNITSFVDHGTLNYSVAFGSPFDDDSFVVGAIGDGSVGFRVIEKSRDIAQLKFDAPCPDVVRLEFRY